MKFIESVKKMLPGCAIALVIAVVAKFLEQLEESVGLHLIGASVIAMFIGMIVNRFYAPNDKTKPGIKFTSKKILKFAIILLGASLNITTVLTVGKFSLTVMLFTLATCFGLGYVIGKALGLDWKTSSLINAGTGICGGSAIAAVAPVIDADENQTSLSLATIFILNAVALFVFPVIGHWLGMGQTQFGTWAAIAIHDTSSVVGAGAAYGEEALKVATTVKLTRALWIIPLSLVSALIFRQKGKKIQIPWFIFWFVVAMLVNTYCNLPTQLTHGISVAARCGLSATLFLIGGGLSIEVIRKVGLKPLVLGIILWAVISVASLAVILLL